MFKPTFNEIVADAQSLVSAVMLQGGGIMRNKSQAPKQSVSFMDGTGTPRDSDRARNRERKRHRAQRPRSKSNARSPSVAPRNGSDQRAAYLKLARAHDRCTDCGWFLHGRPVREHKEARACDVKQFAYRMSTVQKLVNQGIDPNAKLIEAAGGARKA